jgi:hypothetical protein
MNRSSEKLDQKKPYQAPKLLVYGNLTDMTNAVGRSGKSDRGIHGVKRYTGK